MVHALNWKRSLIASSMLALAAISAPQALAAGKTITAVMHSDLRIIDPGFTTAYITRDHGYMVYDTLLATDSNFKVQPQMADWKVSDDKLTYTFTLRDGLKWHDGAPVTAEDCVASLKRWGRADNMGQKLMEYTASLEATDAKTIVLKLKELYGLVLESIAKPSSYVPFMMPKRLAETPADQQITQQIGSGPFKFVQSEFRPGVKAVYEKTRTTCHARSRRDRPLAARWRKLTVSSASRCRTRRLRSMHSSPAKSILWKLCQSICCRYFTRTAISSLRR